MKPDRLSNDAREKLDDAGISLLMEEYLGVEGARLRGEAMHLNSDAEYFYPEALDARCRREIDRHFARERRRSALQKLRKAIQAAAAVLAVAILIWLSRAALFERAGQSALLPALLLSLVLGMFLALLWLEAARRAKNNAAPRLAVDALLVTKRAIPPHPDAAGADQRSSGSAISFAYRITFQVESGDRMEFSVSGNEYERLSEGDYGRLYFQGTRFLGFERA